MKKYEAIINEFRRLNIVTFVTRFGGFLAVVELVEVRGGTAGSKSLEVQEFWSCTTEIELLDTLDMFEKSSTNDQELERTHRIFKDAFAELGVRSHIS